jgi:uncharacterized SAM-binding protein YcdF (DUF218 family)
MNSPSTRVALDQSSSTSFLKPFLMVTFVTMFLPVGITYFVAGKSPAEKILTSMAQPLFLSLVFTLILGCILCQKRERFIGTMLLLVTTGLWLASTSLVVKPLFSYWESLVPDNEDINDLESIVPFDYLVVLGGGSNLAPGGRPQFGDAGDRIGFAASMHLNRKALHLVTTGDVMVVSEGLQRQFKPQDDPSQQTRMLWNRFGIPNESIFEIPGENTSKELASLKEHPEWWQGKRCGIVTSAFHMPRAMRLAKKLGLTVVPVATDYRTGSDPFMVKDLMPESVQLGRLQLILKEWIGMQLGR